MIVKTPITIEQKEYLAKIAKEIDRCKISTTFGTARHHSVKTGTTDQKGARQDVVGIVGSGGEERASIRHQKNPQLMRMFRKFMKMHQPELKFRTVYININTMCKPHLDRNEGESLIIGFGNYKRGQTNLFSMNKDGSMKKTPYDISQNSLTFDGSKIIHSSSDFSGDRYSLVFFK